MKRYLLSIILGFLTFTNVSFGQLEINFADNSANTNGTVDIDVTTNGFTDISVLQFSAGWDSLVMTFNSVTFTNPALPDLNPSNISGPEGATNIESGQFTFSYGSPTGDGNLPDGEILFTVRFDIVGNECDETTLEMTNDPTDIEAFNAVFDELTVSSQSGTIMINGTDCGGGGGDELTITAPMINADMGTNICVPLTVENFLAVQAGSGTILWDPTVLTYTGLANINITGVNGSLNDTNVDNGELKFVWSNPDPANPLTIADGEPIFEICFDVIGNPGDMSPITLSDQGSLGFEWTDDNEDVFPQILNDGKVTVTEMMGDPFVLNVSNMDVQQNENGCVDVTVENFTDILSLQFVITWDGNVLSNPTPSNFNLPLLNANSFNIDGDCATLSWSGTAGLDLADGTTIFSMCFDATGACDATSTVDIISKGNTNIEIIDGNTDEIENVSVNAGSITIDCNTNTDCDIVSIDRTCIGDLGGNIFVSVNPDDNCTYSWANSSGVEVSTDKNLLGVAAGTYILTVTCDGAEVCSVTGTVENFPDLVIGSDITNAACGGLGAIDVSVTMGSGDYSYNWNPSQANSASISDLDPATYNLTVTDNDSGCTKTAEFVVSNEVEEMEIASSIVVDETCVQNDGRISLTIEGGCQPYTFAWSDSNIGNTPNATDLADGDYQVTITDNSSPANSVSGSFTVDGADPLTLVGPASIVASTGNDGSITIEITGGNPSYDYSWTGPTTGLPNSNSVSGLMDGMYTVLVTDSDGCTETFGPFVVPFDNGEPVPEFGDVEAVNNANGFGVVCNGDATGVISGVVTTGETPMTIELSGADSKMIVLENLGTFIFENLAAGTYTVTASNDKGEDVVEDIIITEPDALLISLETGCDNDEQCDGFIDVNASGGFGDYFYELDGEDFTGGSVDNLCVGSYTVMVTDENGCQMMRTVNIESCGGPVDPDCYEVRDVITPNGDGMNDQFVVTCISDFPAALEVYDRWGKLVYNQNPYDGSWMGISNSNEELIEGGYMYIINIDFGQGRREIMKGTLTILRD